MEESAPDPPKGRLNPIPWAIALAIALLAGVAAYYVVFVQPMRAAAQLGRDIVGRLGQLGSFEPRVVVDTTIIHSETVARKELTLASKDFLVRHRFTNTWAGSKKWLQLEGKYNARAGFDLEQVVSVDITSTPLKVRAVLPQPYILSVERRSYLQLEEDSGFWNKITAQEREAAINHLDTVARKQARRSRLTEDARKIFEEELRKVSEKYSAEIEVVYQSPHESQSQLD